MRVRHAILQQFRRSYLLWNGLLSGLAIAILVWYWQQPTGDRLGFVAYTQSIPILLIASLLIHGISFYFQDRYTRNQLRRPNIAMEFRVLLYTIRFYLYNLAIAVLLSVVGFYPLLALLFFFWIYPVLLWLIPYHLLSGAILGWEIKRRLHAAMPEEEL